jgi:hypothetical protein
MTISSSAAHAARTIIAEVPDQLSRPFAHVAENMTCTPAG